MFTGPKPNEKSLKWLSSIKITLFPGSYQPVKSSTPAAGVDLALIDGQSGSATTERRMWQAVAAMTVIAITGEERLWRLSGRR